MCGIAGFINFKNQKIDNSSLIKEMIDKLYFRGPDENGFFIWKNVALGIARLKIIDLLKGSQPISNESKNLVIVFNGEIYNYKELREELILKNHHFKTDSDTEVILHLYEEEKENMFEKLNGMFAFAIFDKNEKKFLIARDRIGIKPLYFFYNQDFFAFASELKAFIPLFKRNIVKKELNYKALVNYLIMEYVPAPYSIFNNIFKLMPGHYLILKENKLKIKKYWDLPLNEGNYSNLNFVKERLYNLLLDSVRLELRSDVPLGIFLSGGIDSSTITYFAKKVTDKISTFSIRFNEPSFDEGLYINYFVEFLNLKHYSKNFTPDEMRKFIKPVFSYLDEPFADASILPTYMLSKFTRQYVKVALGGDGGDELFAGYPTYQAFVLAKYFKFLPDFLQKIIKSLADKLPVSDKNFSFEFKLKKFLSAINSDFIERNFLWLGSFYPNEFKNLFTPEVFKKIKSYNPFEEIILPTEIKKLPPLSQILYLDIKYYLQNDILVKVDRASMANSLEVRPPLLDHRILEFVFNMPINYKLKFLQTKWILKNLMKSYLPHQNVFRSKKGFGIPISKWIKFEMKNEIINLFDKSKIENIGIFNFNYVKNLLIEHLSNKVNNRKKLWTLISFILWYENYFL